MNTQATPASGTMDLTHFDVRVIPCRQKHALIFARWNELPVGAHFVLVNDHDPVPLYYQFAAQFPGAFNWEYLVEGPDEFQVKITRLTASPARPAIAPPFKGCGSGGTPTDVEVDARGLEPPHVHDGRTATPTIRVDGTFGDAGGFVRAGSRAGVGYPELGARGVRYVSEQAADESWITTLSRV